MGGCRSSPHTTAPRAVQPHRGVGGGGSGEASGNSYFQETRINLSLFKPYGANAIGRLSMLHSRNSRASKASFALGVSFPHGLCSVQRTARLKRQER